MMRLFWFLAFALAWCLAGPIALEQLKIVNMGGWPPQLAYLIGFAPALAAIFVSIRTGEVRAMWNNAMRIRVAPWLYIVALVTPFCFLSGPLLAGSKLDLPQGAVFFATIWFILAFGEELGWRGFALPRLTVTHGFWKGSTILGVLWCVWHYPRLYASPYIESFSAGLPWVGLFSIQIMFANYILCWLAVRGRYAVLIPALFHTSFNFAATIYAEAATDPLITLLIGLFVSAIFLFDRDLDDADMREKES
jgi:membrane protease YdiL (CAAX protease family)